MGLAILDEVETILIYEEKLGLGYLWCCLYIGGLSVNKTNQLEVEFDTNNDSLPRGWIAKVYHGCINLFICQISD